ncbi:hypothetical protein NDU88_004718 [Pleurodeles waltl]|uniref:Uncharacterized protein n=1 Tax=Pleurodeles waltl TaxID=8319 RepID=A0AAV7VL64_PLEWA|nr:hypothetical protein NDU88_004718 [Pleurodeles waltl]
MKTPLVIGRDVLTDCPHARSKLRPNGLLLSKSDGPVPRTRDVEPLCREGTTPLSLFVYVPYCGCVVRQDLDRLTAKGREEGLESQKYRLQFQQIDVKPLFHSRPMTFDLHVPQISSRP